MKILLVTGPGGDAQGWGDMKVTNAVSEALNQIGVDTEIAFVSNADDFNQVIDNAAYDIVWSSLYYLSSRSDIVGIREDAIWVADLLDEKQIPYIGSNSETMKNLIQKYKTHQILHSNGILVPEHYLAEINGRLPEVNFPAFVKPNGESRSVGISEKSVVYNSKELAEQVKYIHCSLEQEALIEDYLPGEEYTVLMLGNGKYQKILPGQVTVDEACYGKHRVLRSDLRGVGLTKVILPANEQRAQEAIELVKDAAKALNCLDHVRVDIRAGADGKLRLIEVNGIPGLKPVNSWSPQIYSLYHPSPLGAMDEYRNMLKIIVDSASFRAGFA